MRVPKTILRSLPVVACAVFALALVVFLLARIARSSSTSAEGVLASADKLAWNNNWLAASPLFAKAEEMFLKKGDRSGALYAHVSQVPLRMESGDLSQLIAELSHDLRLTEAKKPQTRLRVLEMKARCEQEYDATLATTTFAEVEDLAFAQRKFHLASRASGEQGILAFTLGNMAEASKRVKRAYAVAKYLGDPPAHVRYAELIGAGLVHMGRPEQALKFLDEAINAQKAHPEIAIPSIAYSAKIDALGQLRRYKESFALADQAMEFPRQQKLYGVLQSTLSTKAEVEERSGASADAIGNYQEALGYAKLLGSVRAITFVDARLARTYERQGKLTEALSAINEAIDANQKTPQEILQVPGNLALKARILAKMGNRAEAEKLYLKGSDVLDAMLTHVPTPEAERLLLTELADLYSGYFELLSNDKRYDEAFRVIEKAHGRVEAQELEYDYAEAPHAATPEEKQLQALEVELIKNEEPSHRAEALLKIQALQPHSENRALNATTSLRSTQEQLSRGEMLVEYVLASPQSYALAISHQSVARYTLPAKDSLEADVRKYRDILRHQQSDLPVGKQLHEELLGFTRDYPGLKSLVIVPDGGLHLLPFSALVASSGKYLLEETPVSMTPSATVLGILRDRAPTLAASKPYLGVAAWTEGPDNRPWVVRAASSDNQSPNLLPLPESRDEVESIAAMMPRPATMLLGHEATKEKFEQLPLGEYRVLHLALHGYVDPVYPDRSALVFAPAGKDNGHLEARDIRRLRLHADLVTLSACDTGIGPVGVSGVESVVAAFIEAGANSVVSTLWELEDHASNKLMKAFYGHLGSAGKADALRQAKLEVLHAGLSPYYWASYEIVGDSQGGLFASR